MRVLVVKSSSLGDIIHTLPALTDAQQHFPTICFDWAVEESFREIPPWHPSVKHTIPLALRRWRKQWHHWQTYREWGQFKRALQSRQYDAVIDAQGLLKSSFFITRLALGPKHGLDRSSLREPLARWGYERCHAVSRQQHAVERSRQLFALSLGYPLPDTLGDYAIRDYLISQERSNPATAPTPYLVFLHATSRAWKFWPTAHWRQLIALLAPTGLKVKLPWGTLAEQRHAYQLAQHHPHAEVLTKSSLSQMAQCLLHARAVVSVDTGLSHLAAALETPNITLYGPTDPALVGGYGKHQSVHRAEPSHTMEAIAPERVLELLTPLISR